MITRFCLYVLRSGFAALDTNDLNTATDLRAALTRHEWEENSTWIIAIARLIDFAKDIHLFIQNSYRADAANAANGTAHLHLAQAEQIMGKMLAILDDEATQEVMLQIVREIDALPTHQQEMQKMARLLPVAQELTAPVLEEHGFTKEQFMAVWMQLQMFACSSPAIKAGLARMMGAMG